MDRYIDNDYKCVTQTIFLNGGLYNFLISLMGSPIEMYYINRTKKKKYIHRGPKICPPSQKYMM